VLDPELIAVLLALAFAAVLAVPGWVKAARRVERFCDSCSRRMLLGEKTCDCD
jgi:type II secretory pathway pseudopilin PulG